MKKILVYFLLLVFFLGICPIAALAVWQPPLPNDKTIYVGVQDNNIAFFNSTLMLANITGLPTGLIFSPNFPNALWVNGTAAPGTVGPHSVTGTAGSDSATVTITVAKGPQTISASKGGTEVTSGGTVTLVIGETLRVFTKNGNGDEITNPTDKPAPAISYGTPGVASDASGTITATAVGTTTVNVTSAATASYNVASAFDFAIKVVAQPTVTLVGTAPSGIVGSVGAQTITVNVANAYNEDVTFTCDINGIPKVATRSGNGDVSFDFTAAEMNGLGVGSYPITISSGATTNNNTITGTVVGNVMVGGTVPTLTGDTTLTLTEGYAATSTSAYTATGSPAPTVEKISGNAAITWNDTTKKLDIAAGLPAGSYPVVLAANNGVNPTARLTFTLTVNAALSSDKTITVFSINGVPGTISGTNITVSLPYGTNVTSLAPQITHTGANVSPANGAAQNFSQPLQYTVTAQDGTMQVYTVTVRVQPAPSPLPKTGDGFPLGALLALMGAMVIAVGWLGLRMRKEKAKA